MQIKRLRNVFFKGTYTIPGIHKSPQDLNPAICLVTKAVQIISSVLLVQVNPFIEVFLVK